MKNVNKKEKSVEFVQWFGPLLDVLRELGGSAKPQEASNQIAVKLKLSDSVLEETLKSGAQRFHNQVAWARQYLVWEGLLDSNKKGIWSLTPKGFETHLTYEQSKVIASKWSRIDRETRQQKTNTKTRIKKVEKESQRIEDIESISLIRILQKVTPQGFEILCKRLLREYGFTNLVVTGGSHDGGIDGYGLLELNPFVSMKVLFQCKRYKGTVSRAQVGDFRNAMIGRAEKGLMITTGIFSEDAKREANREGAPPIELIDGTRLTELFEGVELGVTPRKVFDVDLSYFEPFLTKEK